MPRRRKRDPPIHPCGVPARRPWSTPPPLPRTTISAEAPPPSEPGIRIWLDADAAPRDVKDIVARAALRLEIPTLLVANQRLQTPANNPFVTAVRVQGGPDVADDHIAAEARPGDLAVTADIPLAARLVEKGVCTLDPRGIEYSEANIGERLSIRDFMDGLRTVGVETGGPSAWGTKEKQAFASAFDRLLTRLVRSR